MFRMEFQAMGEVGDVSGAAPRDDITESVYERYRDMDGDAVHTPTVFEGRVGRRFGKVQRVATASASLSARNWMEADLMDFNAPSFQGVTQDERTHHAIFLDAQVLRELVGPFAELPSSGPQVVVDTEATSEFGSDVSRRSTSSYDSSSASEADLAEMDALQRVSKPWQEPLLAVQHQPDPKHKTRKKPKKSERIGAVQQHHELQDLANCVHNAPPSGRTFKRTKLRKVLNRTGVTAVCRFLKNPLRVFKSSRIYDGHLAAREGVNAVVMPRRAKSAFSPSETAAADAALALMRSAPRKARSSIQFETVQSTQRDAEAWTMEEYMTKNARLQNWNSRKDDEEFGGIEGNNLMNQYLDDNVTYNSDSD